MAHIIRRALSTVPHASTSRAIPTLPSLTATAPLAVRQRRETQAAHKRPPSHTKLPLQLESEYQALRAQGQYKGDEASGRKVFWERQVLKRGRVRGVIESGADSSSKSARTTAVEGDGKQVVGQRIYLPNVSIRLMRNATLPGQAYDPNVATFRMPHGMTKTDLRSYLAAVYNLSVSFIRTDNYYGTVIRSKQGRKVIAGGSGVSYKRAIVGLLEPFHYPDDLEELHAIGAVSGVGSKFADERKVWIEERYRRDQIGEMRKKVIKKFRVGGKWRAGTYSNSGSIVRDIMRKRSEKEAELAEEVKKVRAAASMTA